MKPKNIEEAISIVRNAVWNMIDEEDGSDYAYSYRCAKTYLLNRGYSKEEIEEFELELEEQY